jgi:hypothetical protein
MTKGRQKTYQAYLQKTYNHESLNVPFNPPISPVPLEIIKKIFHNNEPEPEESDDESSESIIPVNNPPKKGNRTLYFKIVRHTKRGKRRLKDNSKLHDNFSQYNIICKIKVYLTKSLIKQANNLYKKNIKEDALKNEEFLIPIHFKEKKGKKSRNMNVDWFFQTAKEYLSSNISGKYNAHSKDHNKNKIEEVFKENKNKDLINFLETNVNTIYKEYISIEESQNEIFKGLSKIYTDLDNINSEKKYEESYIKEVKRISADLENILSNKRDKGNQKKKSK